MSYAVRYQVATLGIGKDAPSGNGLVDGDVILTNSPSAGGSHLPDLTVITPVFDADKKNIIFFTASRGHHADIGGVTAGSMSPNATTIFQEGARIATFKIVREGKFDREGLYERLVIEPASYPGSSGSRCFRDVESDLQAQIAANHRAIQLLHGREFHRSCRKVFKSALIILLSSFSDRRVWASNSPKVHGVHPRQRRICHPESVAQGC